MFDVLVQQIRNEVTTLGIGELRTPEEVDAAIARQNGTVLIFVNSVCGCAGGIARPALRLALRHPTKPDLIASVFASSDREATAHARSYFTDMPSSSPSFALLRDGKLIHMLHRSDIEDRSPGEVAEMLTDLFDRYCGNAV